MAQKIVIAEFEFDSTAIQEARDENIKLKQALIELKKEQTYLNNVVKNSGKATKNQARILSENDEKLKTLNATYRDNSKVIQANASSVSNVNKLLNQSIRTEAQAIKSNRQLLAARKGVNISTAEGRKQVQLLNEKINLNNKVLDSTADKYSAQKRNIGNYSSALGALSPRMSGFINNLGMMKKAYEAQVIGLKASNKGLKAFRIALIATGIGAIVVILGTLIGAFLKTQRGVDAVTSVLTPLRVVMETLWGVVEQLGTSLVDAFKNPKKAINDLWGLVKTQIVNRFEGLGGLFKNVGQLLESVFNPDVKVSDVWEDMQNNLGKMVVGVDDIKEKWGKATDVMDEAWKRGKKIHEVAIEIDEKEAEIALKRERNLNLIREAELITKDKSKSQKEINKALSEAERLNKENLNNENEIIKLKVKKLKLDQNSNDTSRAEYKELNELESQLEINKGKARGIELRFLGVKNRMQAQGSKQYQANLKEEARLIKEQNDKVLSDLGTELELYKEKNKEILKNDDELSQAILNGQLAVYNEIATRKKEIADREKEYGKLNQKEYDLALLQIENEHLENVSALKTDFADREKEQKQEELEIKREQNTLDFDLEMENLLLQKEALIEVEALQHERELELLNQKLLDKQLSQEQYNKALENETKRHADIVVAIEQAKEDARIKAVSDTFGNVSELLGKQTVAGKLAGVAQATINTYQGVTEIWRSPTVLPEPFGTIQKVASTGIALASGLKAVKQIHSVKTPKAEKGLFINGLAQGKSHSEGGIGIEMEGGEAVINKRSMANPILRNFASAINVAGGGIDFSSPSNSYMADGGLTANLLESNATSNQTIKVVNVVEDTISTYDNEIVQVENVANL